MSDRHEFPSDDAIDLAVSRAYRAGATEKVPVHLDRVVLAEAKQESGRKPWAPGLPGWLVPTAFAAVLALSLSFNLEFNQPDLSPAGQDRAGPEESNIAATAVDSTEDLETAVESTGIRLRALDDAVSNLAPGNRPQSSPEASGVGANGQSTSLAADVQIADRSCGTEATAAAETWWSCVEALQRTGQADAARAELELLEAAFPEFELAR